MTIYNRLALEQIFDSIWEHWINKEGESAARKAIDVFLKSGNSKSDLEKACEIYRLENLGNDPEFTYKLSNFLNQDHWRDTIEGSSLEKLKKRYEDSIEVVEAWNAACRKHWCPVLDVETRVPLATKALSNKPFKEQWSVALELAKSIFQFQFSDDDYRSRIILSFKWFTNVSSDKHTVLRIMEGEYGEARFTRTKIYPSLPCRVMTPEEREILKQDMKEVFHGKLFQDREESTPSDTGVDPFKFV